jgi:large subunit ribosomal protein L27
MAHVKAGGTAKNLKDSQSQRLGVKIFGGQKITAGQIIIRQRGQKYLPGQNVRLGVDHTAYALKDGIVKFQKKKVKRFTGALHQKTIVHVI